MLALTNKQKRVNSLVSRNYKAARCKGRTGDLFVRKLSRNVVRRPKHVSGSGSKRSQRLTSWQGTIRPVRELAGIQFRRDPEDEERYIVSPRPAPDRRNPAALQPPEGRGCDYRTKSVFLR